MHRPSKLCRNDKTTHALETRTPARQAEQARRAQQLKKRRKRGSATGRHAPLGTYTRSLPNRHCSNWNFHRRQELLSSASTRQMMIVDDDDKGCALRTARHAQCAVLRCGCHRPVDADENNRKGRGHEKNREGSLHQTWRRVRSRFMLELPTGTLWSTVFEHPFIILVRHAPTHTPGSRSQGIVIPRTKHVRYKHRGSHDTLFRSQVQLTRLPTWSCFFFSDTGPPTQEHQIIC